MDEWYLITKVFMYIPQLVFLLIIPELHCTHFATIFKTH